MQIGSLSLSRKKPLIMGILNVTPDSFSDGGHYNALDSAITHANEMMSQGADIIDVGGESTRPGAEPVSLQQEMDRVLPVIERLSHSLDVTISVDTSSPQIMKEAVGMGASLINDVRALSKEGALEMASTLDVPICLMHMRGTPKDMQLSPGYSDVIDVVKNYLQLRIDVSLSAGISRNRVLIDPGFGFGKTLRHNLAMLKHLNEFDALGCPLLVGISRKTMIGEILSKSVDDRLFGSVGAAVVAAMKGASILRVHDVQETADALAVVSAMKEFK